MVDAEVDLRCPITLNYFRDPVTTNDNHIYERNAIIRWITITGTDPITRKELRIDQLVPNKRIKMLAEQHRKLSASNSSAGDSQVGLSSLKSVCIDVPMMTISSTNSSSVTNNRSRPCERMRSTCCCCSPCRGPLLCIIILLIVCAIGIGSILAISIVMSRSHAS